MDTPASLAEAGAALWASIAGTYELRPDEVAVLAAACKTADIIAELEREWLNMGRPFMTRGSMGQDVIHPLIAEMKTQRAAQAALLRQLKLPDEAGGEKANQQRSAAQSRWAAHGKGA